MKGLRRTIAPTAGLVGVLSLTWIAFQQERFDLTGALKSCRPTEGWLSIESSYAAYSSGSARCLPGKSLARIEKEIDEKITTAPSAEAFSDLGRLKLAANQPEEAAVALEEASRRAPNDPKVWNDLAVAYIATASQGQPANLARAIASAQRAIDLNGALAAPRFNFALALELLYPTELAIAAWEEFLLAAKDSEWVEEASTRLARLREPSSRELWAKARSRLDQGSFASDLEDLNELAARFPQQVRVYVEETLLPRWGERALDGQTTDAADLVQIAKQLGESLAKRGGDHMVADALAAINRAQSSPGALQALAAGHRDFGQGLAAYGNAEIQKAAELLRSSAAEFRRGESPFVHWAEYYLAVCLFQRSDYPAVQRSLEPLVAEGTANRYPNLAGKALWLRGLTHVVQSELTDSLANYLRARELFARTGEAENLAVVHNLLSENFGYLGDSRVRWEHLHRALAAAREVQTPRRIHLLAREAGDACLLLGEPSVALLFEEAALRALPADDAVGRAIALLKLSRIHLGLGKEANALAVLDDAMQEIQQIPAPELRESLRGDVLLAKGSLASGKDLILAGDSFDEALEIYRRTRYWRQVPKLLLKRALVDLGQGQEDLAAANLKGAVQEIERQRADFSDETSRVTFMDSLHDVFDRWVQLDVERGAFDRAFDHAEQGRARALLDVVGRQGEGSTVSGPLTLTEIQRSLPERTAVVVYDVLPDRWIAWVVRRNGVHFVQSDTPEAALDRMVDRFRTALQRENAGRTVDEASQTLSRELLLPLAGFLSGAELLVFVPDKSFHRLPFAALRDPGSGRFLVEVYAVAKAPSATIYVETLERARRLRSLQRPNLLVVGDPAFDPADFPYLDSLQFARSEAARIAALYPEVFSLTGEAATKEAFTAAAGLHDIVHFAGHGIPNYKTPRRAGLLFAPGSRSGASPLLSVAEIESMQLPRTRLVILSACSSSDGGISVGEGVLGLARSFLAAGVPTVLGSLWDVKDKETTDFMVFFHERLREGNDPLAAFREAQRAALARTGTSGLWAAFEIIGGVEPLHLGARP
jgi:CHAT domain-containing protein